MKKILSLVLSVVMLLSCFALSATAWVNSNGTVSNANKGDLDITDKTGHYDYQVPMSYTWATGAPEFGISGFGGLNNGQNGGISLVGNGQAAPYINVSVDSLKDALVIKMNVSMDAADTARHFAIDAIYSDGTSQFLAGSFAPITTFETYTKLKLTADMIDSAKGEDGSIWLYFVLPQAAKEGTTLNTLKLYPWRLGSAAETADKKIDIHSMTISSYMDYDGFTVSPEDENGVAVDGATVADYQGKKAYQASGTVTLTNALFEATTLPYILVDCYFETAPTALPTIALSADGGGNFTLYPYADETTPYTAATIPLQDWTTLAFPVTASNINTGNDDVHTIKISNIANIASVTLSAKDVFAEGDSNVYKVPLTYYAWGQDNLGKPGFSGYGSIETPTTPRGPFQAQSASANLQFTFPSLTNAKVIKANVIMEAADNAGASFYARAQYSDESANSYSNWILGTFEPITGQNPYTKTKWTSAMYDTYKKADGSVDVYFMLPEKADATLDKVMLMPWNSGAAADVAGKTVTVKSLSVYTANDYEGMTITPDGKHNAVFTNTDSTAVTAADYQGKKTYQATGADVTLTQAYFEAKTVHFIKVDCFFETAPAAVPTIALTADGGGNFTLYPHIVADTYSEATKLTVSDIPTGEWTTLVFPVMASNMNDTNDDVHTVKISGVANIAAVVLSTKTEQMDPVIIRGLQQKLVTVDEVTTRTLRFVATLQKGVDYTKYSNVGFDIVSVVPVGGAWDKNTNSLYTSINAAGDIITAESIGGEYIAVAELNAVPVGEAIELTVTPYMTKLDGSKIYGDAITVNITTDGVITAAYN